MLVGLLLPAHLLQRGFQRAVGGVLHDDVEHFVIHERVKKSVPILRSGQLVNGFCTNSKFFCCGKRID